MNKELLEQVRENFLLKEKQLSRYATKSKEGIRLKKEVRLDEFRPEFYHDIDRIIHALSYTRYLNKTQVFSFNQNDHISKRIVHVQLVSKIARTIGRALNLNEDLIEAIALGHDIGHTPIGHVGESLLNEISYQETNTFFSHNIQSVRTYMNLEKNQQGINLTIQVLDGIMCHNGEMLENVYRPKKKTTEEFLKEYELCYTDKETLKKVRPMTLEGCVVRISDIIGYIGRDIEDAINIGVLKREESIEKPTVGDVEDAVEKNKGCGKEMANYIDHILCLSYDQNPDMQQSGDRNGLIIRSKSPLKGRMIHRKEDGTEDTEEITL